ncbi:MAG TPA: excinuclease ABC subunit UvrA [Chloroflexi bacterium]|jgi:excinuclease ABC subunit A|nr:excinuclease ABC subunit UvrA [Chloroflexota bacterium]
MTRDTIHVRGAREHNLKNVELEIPRGSLVVFSGISGSGKSSLAFDTIFAEGQRRYVESLSAYARQFLGQLDKPDVDYIDGLSPAISIDQKSASHNPRSTVGTVTEIYDYLRLLYARIGHPHCPKCGREIQRQSVEQIVDDVMAMPPGSRIMILGPVVRGRKGEYRHVFEEARKAGYIRVRVDGEVRELAEDFPLDKYKQHDIEVVVDRLVLPESDVDRDALAADRSRLADSVETALKLGEGIAIVKHLDGPERLFSEHFACVVCGISLPEIEPRTFSFNSPHGACPDCTGLGTKKELDPGQVIPNKSLSLAQGAVHPWARSGTSSPYYMSLLKAVAEQYGFSVETPVEELAPEDLDKVMYGSGKDTVPVRRHNRRIMHVHYEGVIPNLLRRYRDTDSEWMRSELDQYMTNVACPTCGGARLRPESIGVTVGGQSIVQVTQNSIRSAARYFAAISGDEPLRKGEVSLTERERLIGRQIIKEIRARLRFLLDVGLDYLTLDRTAATLAGGEAQRIRLATQIGSGLMGVLYILDEPSIGLHQRDNARLIRTLEHLRDLGNTLIVVEHDEETMRAADHVVDIGPGAGEHGGHLVAQGTLDDVMRAPDSITGQYLSGKRQIRVPAHRRSGSGESIVVRGARANNLKNIDVSFPLGRFLCVTGVSGSGKSTLVNEILFRAASQRLNKSRERAALHDSVFGFSHLDKVIDIDQSPIGRTPRSNPATYTGAFTPIRELFAALPDAKIRGYKPGRFSFNVKGGRCEACRGEGIIQIEMHFLPDVYVPCEVCKGKRYNREALEIKFKDKSIADVLDMTVEEALTLFENMPTISNKMRTLRDVGLGYIRVGQPSTTLSGGEAQRIKLATELSKRATGKTLYILDEPTTGLHFADVEKLLLVLNRLVDAGNTVVVIEHNLDVIKTADWVIDLGPEGGDKGGTVVAEGTPEDIAACKSSFTGQFLRPVLHQQLAALAG